MSELLNPEAEAEIARLADMGVITPGLLRIRYRAAMRWAYQDAARSAKEFRDPNDGELAALDTESVAVGIASAIDDRTKG